MQKTELNISYVITLCSVTGMPMAVGNFKNDKDRCFGSDGSINVKETCIRCIPTAFTAILTLHMSSAMKSLDRKFS